MFRLIICIVFLCLICESSPAKANKDIVVGNFGLHFDELGNIIKPDEFYFFEAMENSKKGYRESALKNFRKSASYGNTFGAYYTGLMYLQDGDQVKGLAWLSISNNKGFIFKDKVESLLEKLKHAMNESELNEAHDFNQQLDDIYGVEATFNRRIKWSRNFRLAGTKIKGYVPRGIKIQTDLSSNSEVGGSPNSFINDISMKKQLHDFVYEYNMDYRLVDGEVNVLDVELSDEN